MINKKVLYEKIQNLLFLLNTARIMKKSIIRLAIN